MFSPQRPTVIQWHPLPTTPYHTSYQTSYHHPLPYRCSPACSCTIAHCAFPNSTECHLIIPDHFSVRKVLLLHTATAPRHCTLPPYTEYYGLHGSVLAYNTGETHLVKYKYLHVPCPCGFSKDHTFQWLVGSYYNVGCRWGTCLDLRQPEQQNFHFLQEDLVQYSVFSTLYHPISCYSDIRGSRAWSSTCTCVHTGAGRLMLFRLGKHHLQVLPFSYYLFLPGPGYVKHHDRHISFAQRLLRANFSGQITLTAVSY